MSIPPSVYVESDHVKNVSPEGDGEDSQHIYGNHVDSLDRLTQDKNNGVDLNIRDNNTLGEQSPSVNFVGFVTAQHRKLSEQVANG